MQHPGEVWFLPPDARQDGDPKTRRHVLLTTCGDSSDVAILAYASTQGTEAAFGAANVLLDPFATAYGSRGRTGFVHPTYIYPSRLVSAAPADLIQLKGRIIDEMAAIRAKLQWALGTGTGTANGQGRAAGSWRGRVVEFSDVFAGEIGCSYGVVVTEPGYSNTQRYQTIVPLLDPEEFESADNDLIVLDQPWVPRINAAMHAAWLAVDMVQTVFHPAEISRWAGATVDEGTMAELDAYLLNLFGL
jgi:hypothetical protein